MRHSLSLARNRRSVVHATRPLSLIVVPSAQFETLMARGKAAFNLSDRIRYSSVWRQHLPRRALEHTICGLLEFTICRLRLLAGRNLWIVCEWQSISQLGETDCVETSEPHGGKRWQQITHRRETNRTGGSHSTAKLCRFDPVPEACQPP